MKYIIISIILISIKTNNCIDEALVRKLKLDLSLYSEINNTSVNGEESIIIPFEDDSIRIISNLGNSNSFYINEKKIICNDSIPFRIFEFENARCFVFKGNYLVVELKVRASGLASNLIGCFILNLEDLTLNYVEGYFQSDYIVNDYNNDDILDFIKLELKTFNDTNYFVCPSIYSLKNGHFVYIANTEIENCKIQLEKEDCKD